MPLGNTSWGQINNGKCGFTATSACGAGDFADIVTWDTLSHAQTAVKRFEMGDARLTPCMLANGKLTYMGDFVPERQPLPDADRA